MQIARTVCLEHAWSAGLLAESGRLARWEHAEAWWLCGSSRRRGADTPAGL